MPDPRPISEVVNGQINDLKRRIRVYANNLSEDTKDADYLDQLNNISSLSNTATSISGLLDQLYILKLVKLQAD